MQELFFAQKAFIVRDDHLLIVRKSMDDPDQPGMWEVPGGRMSFGEDIDEHLKREVREEVGLEIRPGAPFHIWQWRLSRRAQDGTALDFQIVAVARFCTPLTEQLSASNRVHEDFLGEMLWVHYDDLKNYPFIPNMLPVIESFLESEKGRRASS